MSTVATRDYQRAQVALRALTYKDISKLWALLDPTRLDRTFTVFAAAVLQLIRQRRQSSASFARAYLKTLRAGVPGEAPEITAPPLATTEALVSLRYASVVSIKTAMKRGTSLDLAVRNALVRTMGVADKYINDGGRELIRLSVEADPSARGWVRRTLGTCTYCTKQASGEEVRPGSADFPRHDHCGCTPEPVYVAAEYEEEYVEKILDILKQGTKRERAANLAEARRVMADVNAAPLSRSNMAEAVRRLEAPVVQATKKAAAPAVKKAEAPTAAPATSADSALTPRALQNALDPTRKRTAAAIRKELEATPGGRSLSAAIKGFTETRGGVVNLRKNIAKTLDGTASDAVSVKTRAFLDAMNHYPTGDVPTLYRGIAVRVEENTDAWWDAFEAQFQPGQRMNLNASSFTSSEKKAAEFQNMLGGTRRASSDHTAVRIVLEDNPHALPVEQLSKFKSEKEWIAGGEFEVVGYQPATKAQPYYRVVVRQVETLRAP